MRDAEIARRLGVSQSTVLRHLGPASVQDELPPQPAPEPEHQPGAQHDPVPGPARQHEQEQEPLDEQPRAGGAGHGGAAGTGAGTAAGRAVFSRCRGRSKPCPPVTPRRPRLPPTSIISDNLVAWLGATGAMAALARRAVEGGSYRVNVSLTRAAMWATSLGVLDEEYVARTVGTGGEHELIDPQLFTSLTPLGVYQGVTENVTLSRAPHHYMNVLSPKGADQPAWLPRPRAGRRPRTGIHPDAVETGCALRPVPHGPVRGRSVSDTSGPPQRRRRRR